MGLFSGAVEFPSNRIHIHGTICGLWMNEAKRGAEGSGGTLLRAQLRPRPSASCHPRLRTSTHHKPLHITNKGEQSSATTAAAYHQLLSLVCGRWLRRVRCISTHVRSDESERNPPPNVAGDVTYDCAPNHTHGSAPNHIITLP
jgi:hypothetical protein